MRLRGLAMTWTKYKVSQLIKTVDERNSLGITAFYGINIDKEFMLTAANTEGLDSTKYKVVRKNCFVFSGMQTGRDVCIRISLYLGDNPIIVSPAYTTFEILSTDIVIPAYFFMLFRSTEKDRLGWFYSDGSIRSNLDWDRFCDIELELPDISTQQKYVAIYKAMQANQQSYERGLEDLRRTFEALVDEQKHSAPKRSMGTILSEIDQRNSDGKITDVQGINIFKQFMPSVANTTGVDLTKYKVVQKGQFAFSGMQTGRDECIRIALYARNKPIIISPAYTVMVPIDDTVLPEYVMIWFSRKESDRLGWFMSDASIRTNLDLERFFEIEIPVPSLEIQKTIAEIYSVYIARCNINEKLKAQINSICPILIRGSISDGG